MKYYRVKPGSDQQQVITKSPANGSWSVRATLIANELFTEKELPRKLGISKTYWPNFIKNHFEEVYLKPKQTYFFFGSRREATLKSN